MNLYLLQWTFETSLQPFKICKSNMQIFVARPTKQGQDLGGSRCWAFAQDTPGERKNTLGFAGSPDTPGEQKKKCLGLRRRSPEKRRLRCRTINLAYPGRVKDWETAPRGWAYLVIASSSVDRPWPTTATSDPKSTAYPHGSSEKSHQWVPLSKPTRVSSSLIGCPFHMALCHI